MIDCSGMARRIRHILTVCALVLLRQFASAQAFDFRCLEQGNGLPAAGVYHLAEDSLGRLLIGTEGGGFARYDGRSFTVWDHTNGLNADTVRCLYPAANGTVWVGTGGGGLWRFVNDSFYVETADILRRTEVRALTATADGRLYIGTLGSGLLVKEKERVTRIVDIQVNDIRALLTSSNDQLIVGTDSGAFVHRNGRFTPILHPSTQKKAPAIFCLFEDCQKRIWAGTNDGPIIITDSGWQAAPYPAPAGERVRTIAEDQQGDLWFGTQSGAFELEERNNKLHLYTTESGLSNNRIRNIYRDRSGTLWFSTYFGGICQLTSQSVVFFNREQGFPQSPVNDVVLTDDSMVWLGSFDGTLYRWTEGERPQRIFQTRTLFQNNAITALTVIGDSTHRNLYIATEYDGVVRYDLRDQEIDVDVDLAPRWLTGEVFALTTLNKRLLVGGTNALVSGSMRLLPSMMGADRFTALAVKGDSVLAGTNVGLFLLEADLSGGTLIEETDGKEISALSIDFTGQVWLGTLRDGLFRLRDGRVRREAKRELPDNRIVGIDLDPRQDVWVATRKGITRLELDPSQEIILGSTHFGVEHGLSGQINGQALAWDSRNHLWMGNSRGLFRLDPEGVFANPTPPGLRITGLRLFYETPDWSVLELDKLVNGLPIGLTLPYDQNHITFDFTAFDLADPDHTVFQCRLEGYDPEWIDLGLRQTQTYPILPPGDYTFLVRSRNSSGLWNENPLAFPFRISPPWYAHPLAIILAIAALIVGVWAIVRWRLQVLRRKNEILESLVRERTREADEAREKSDRLLLNILPQATADELKETGTAKARRYDEVSVLFSDLKGFTGIAEQITADELVAMLDATFRVFDQACDRFGIEKIKTMGDAYMCVCGLPEAHSDHALRMVGFAEAMLEGVAEVNRRYADRNLPEIQIRIGIHSGPVIAGVVGDKKFAYDIWGDTVNIAARMESSGHVGRINITPETYRRIADHYHCESRGKIAAKNKGELEMYFVTGKRTV